MAVMNWDEAGKRAGASGGTGKYLRFEDGDTRSVVIVGLPACGYKDAPWGVSERFALNAYLPAERKMAILETSPTVFTDLRKQLIKFSERYGGQTGFALEITRNGTGKNTRYTITFDGETKPEVRAAAEAETPYDLDFECGYADTPEAATAQGGGSYNGQSVPAGGDVPF